MNPATDLQKKKIEFAKLYSKCFKNAVKEIDECYHPSCSEKSINSHLLQKNGILSSIAPDKHLWELGINHFKEPIFSFERKGINKIFSFNCFCNKHDTELFKKIETEKIDFSDYETGLLFSLRSLYNEIFRKEVVIKTNKCLIKTLPEKFNNPIFKEETRQQELGLKDLKHIEDDVWNDLQNNTQTYVFESREIEKIEFCVSSFYNYDTTEEMQKYIRENNKEMDRVAEIFINCFPQEENSILLMGYNKKDEEKVKGYFYTFFKEKEKKVQRKITNLALFNCETWVASDKFYEQNVEGIEEIFSDAVNFSNRNLNERRTFDLNFFKADFKDKFKIWKKNVG